MLSGGLGGWGSRHKAAVAHDNDFVGHALDFVELVRNINDAHTPSLELGNQREKTLGFGRCQRRRRLVHDQQPGIARNRLGDFNELFFGHDQVTHFRFRAGSQPDLLHRCQGGGVHALIVEEPAFHALMAKEYVLRDAQMIGEIELLVDQDNALTFGFARVGEAVRHAIDGEIASSRLFIAGENLDQRRFPRAVLAQQADDATRFQLEADAVQHFDESETLADRAKIDG